MAETRATIRNDIRSKLHAWPDIVTTLSAAITTTTATSLTLTSGTGVSDRMLLEIDSEIILVVTFSGTTVSVMVRGYMGTTAATHSNGATVNGYPFWGWTDTSINRAIDKAMDWLGESGVWTLVPKSNTFLSGFREFGLPSGTFYPNGDIVKRIEILDTDGVYKEILGWRHMGDRIILNQVTTQDWSVRIWVQTRQARLSSDSTQLDNVAFSEAIIMYCTARLMEELVANRTRYYEYSASLNDRASTPDELQRTAYFFFNQATILADKMSRPGLSGFAAIIKPY